MGRPAHQMLTRVGFHSDCGASPDTRQIQSASSHDGYNLWETRTTCQWPPPAKRLEMSDRSGTLARRHNSEPALDQPTERF